MLGRIVLDGLSTTRKSILLLGPRQVGKQPRMLSGLRSFRTAANKPVEGVIVCRVPRPQQFASEDVACHYATFLGETLPALTTGEGKIDRVDETS